jgi:hypothetical protein
MRIKSQVRLAPSHNSVPTEGKRGRVRLKSLFSFYATVSVLLAMISANEVLNVSVLEMHSALSSYALSKSTVALSNSMTTLQVHFLPTLMDHVQKEVSEAPFPLFS